MPFFDCRFEGNQALSGGAIQTGGNIPLLKACHFTGNVACGQGGALSVQGTLACENCLFAGNLAWERVSAVYCTGQSLFTHCTFADNRSSEGDLFLAPGGRGGPARIMLTHCIVWGVPGGLDPTDWSLSRTEIIFANVQGDYPGEGNLNVDPLFAQPGTWNLNGTPDDVTDDVWTGGDYHLVSQAGRWDPTSESWVADEETSPCIDAGDPVSPIGHEPFPNGGVVNLGAYGGTTEASRSYFGEPVCETHMAGDINGDCKVDLLDLLIVVAQWTEGLSQPIPSVVIAEPQDGDVFEDPSEPILIRVEVTDPDFQVTHMRIEITQETEDVHYEGGFSAAKGQDGRFLQRSPANRRGHSVNSGDFTIVAEASDSGYRLETSQPVVSTVRP